MTFLPTKRSTFIDSTLMLTTSRHVGLIIQKPTPSWKLLLETGIERMFRSFCWVESNRKVIYFTEILGSYYRQAMAAGKSQSTVHHFKPEDTMEQWTDTANLLNTNIWGPTLTSSGNSNTPHLIRSSTRGSICQEKILSQRTANDRNFPPPMSILNPSPPDE